MPNRIYTINQDGDVFHLHTVLGTVQFVATFWMSGWSIDLINFRIAAQKNPRWSPEENGIEAEAEYSWPRITDTVEDSSKIIERLLDIIEELYNRDVRDEPGKIYNLPNSWED